MGAFFDAGAITLHHGDCIEVMRGLPDASVDAVVTDPPYGLAATDFRHVVDALQRWFGGERDYVPDTGGGFMGKRWDDFVPPPAAWDEAYRLLKPGGHLLAFAGSRTHDLMAMSIRLAGFEIRDSIAWLYGSGFPKSLDVSKAIDKMLGAERAKIEVRSAASAYSANAGNHRPWMDEAAANGGVRAVDSDEPATAAAAAWEGWGTALKPAFEPIVVARKPLAGTVAANVLAHGTGALNIDACRIEAHDDQLAAKYASVQAAGPRENSVYGTDSRDRSGSAPHEAGRWPANVVLDGYQADELDAEAGVTSSHGGGRRTSGGWFGSGGGAPIAPGDTGPASRFFPVFRYQAKAPTSERPRVAREGAGMKATSYGQIKNRQCNVCGSRTCPPGGEAVGKPWPSCGHNDWSWVEQRGGGEEFLSHPTVKPLDLMRWLVRLVTPPAGVVLEPFAGSGTTVEACLREGFGCIAIEREADYLPLILQRIEKPHEVSLFDEMLGGGDAA